MLFLALAVFVIAALTLLELRQGSRLDRNRALNLACWALRLTLAATLIPLIQISAPYSLFDLTWLPWVFQLAIFLLAIDFAEYLFHRAQHAIPFMWAMHSLHHSDPDMNATTTERQHWAEQPLKFMTIYPAVVFLIAADGSIGVVYMLVSLWNYFSHTAIPVNFGRFSWILNSPAYHRRHHSSLPEHYNSNYAALFPIFDVIFGAYNKPYGFPPTGLDGKPENFAEFVTWPLRARMRRSRYGEA